MPGNKRRRLWTLGIADSEFFQRYPLKGLITKMEARVIALAGLGLRDDSVVWDIGAGSGSVSIEAGRLAARGDIYAVEKSPADIKNIEKNIAKFGASNVHIVAAFAPEGLDALPDPDAVFIGGTGGRLEPILRCVCARLKSGGKLVLNAASLENMASAKALLDVVGWRTEVTIAAIARSRSLKNLTRFESLNPVFILRAQRGEAVPSTSRGCEK